MQMAHDDHKGKHSEAKAETEIWTCSMHPQIRQPEPGNCPICGMKLIPVNTSGGGIRHIKLDRETIKLMQIKTSPVERRFVEATVRMVGKIDYDETRVKRITAWVGGRLDRLFVDYTGVKVDDGDHMVLMYSPELYSAQTELLQAIKYKQAAGGKFESGIDLVESSREKLRLFGMTPQQIQEIETKGKASYQLTIFAPMGGIVVKKFRNQGDYVKIGDPIYTIADLSHVWVQMDAYESDLQWIRYGQQVNFTTEAFPGEVFKGRIAFIDPVLNDQTRTVKVRVNVDNPDGKLKPEMLVRGTVHSSIAAGGRVMDPSLAGKWVSPMHPSVVKDDPGKCPICGMQLVRAESLGFVSPETGKLTKPLVVPKSAVLITGTRAVVYVELPQPLDAPKDEPPTYEGREIVLGPRAGDYYLVRSGLHEGEVVVTHGNFKIDSALQIQAKPSMMTPEGGGGGGHDHGGHGNTGKTQKSSAGMENIPPNFHKQLSGLDKAHKDILAAAEVDNLERIRTEFEEFGKSLHKVDTKLLKGHAHMLWQEMTMLLHNDVVEGHNLKRLDQAPRVLASLNQHLSRLKNLFGHAHGAPDTAVPDEFKVQLGNLWHAYLPLQKALAKDDLANAQKAVPELQKALAAVDSKLLPEGAQAYWDRERQQMGKVVAQLQSVKDLKTMREYFSPLSGGLLASVKVFGVEKTGPIYELHCSMAFNHRGASWLQGQNQPHNPYFGAAMPACASRVQLIAGNETATPEKGGHHHHE